MQEYFEEDKKSRFNAGVAHIMRIDSLQQAINAAKFNPLAKNMETGTFNYEIMMAAADCLVSEGWEKFNDKEKEQMMRMNNVLSGLSKFYPPISFDNNGKARLNKVNYEKFLNFFTLYERKLKELYGIHHLNSPSLEDDDGL